MVAHFPRKGKENMAKCRKCRAEIPAESKFCPHCGVKQSVASKPKQRGNGQGSAYQLPNKTWACAKTIGYELREDGSKKRVTKIKKGFRTKKEALDYLATMTATPDTKAYTLQELYDMWLPTHRAGKSTMNCYKGAWKYYASIASMKVNEITIDDLQDCVDDCPKGRRTKENMKALCGLLYKYGIPRRITDIEMGQYLKVSGENGSKDGLPMEAVEKIRQHVETVKWADYVLCQCYLGFRPSEFLSLDAIHYDRNERAFTGGSKTDAGRDRIVTVSPKIQDIVDRLAGDKLSGPVFCGPDGSRMGIKAYRECFYEVLEKCGIENPVEVKDGVTFHKYTPHSCRHTFATMMKRVTAADKDKLALIGHTSDTMLRHYQDVSYDDLRKITNAL